MMPTNKPQKTFLVGGIAVPLRAPCVCGASLGSHLQKAPYPYGKRGCSGFRPKGGR